jgi:four helix bundle protein
VPHRPPQRVLDPEPQRQPQPDRQPQPQREPRSKSSDAARRIRRAADSVPNHLAEGRKRLGKDRGHHSSIAAGSADEVDTTVQVAVARGKLQQSEVDEALRLLDRVLTRTWRLTH